MELHRLLRLVLRHARAGFGQPQFRHLQGLGHRGSHPVERTQKPHLPGDAVATFTNPNTDTASWIDGGVAKGGNYGDAIAAPITPALGRFVLPRENDQPNPDKRLEIYRLPAAGHKSDVRLRFAQIGTASWYWGVDNLKFYDVAAPPVPVLTIAKSGGGITIY